MANPLDSTRIHPEFYKPATKVAMDAMDVGDTAQNSGSDLNEAELQAVRDIFHDNTGRLDGLVLHQVMGDVNEQTREGCKDICQIGSRSWGAG